MRNGYNKSTHTKHDALSIVEAKMFLQTEVLCMYVQYKVNVYNIVIIIHITGVRLGKERSVWKSKPLRINMYNQSIILSATCRMLFFMRSFFVAKCPMY